MTCFKLNKIYRTKLFFLGLLSAFLIPCLASCKKEEEIQGVEIAKLTNAPNVPAPINRKHPTKVIVNLEIIEKTMKLADGVDYVFWTFGGYVPGSFIRVRQGDLLEIHLSNNASNKLPHNLDMHALTGPGGGAVASFTAPGHTSVFSFTSLNPGLFVYHCATDPVGMHIANGMYGLILVEPKEGLPAVDREFYVMQGEFYTNGPYGEKGLQSFDMQKAINENPDYVLFNGSVGALTGDRALKAKVGERVRIFIGNGGPNLISSFHVIGEIFDMVYQEGGSVPNHNVQTTLIPAGGAAIVEFKVQVPGTFTLIDHSVFRAFNKGAIAQLEVDGPLNKKIFSGKSEDKLYTGNPAGQDALLMNGANSAGTSNMSKDELISLGGKVYNSTCMACHQANGTGLTNVFPPLAQSDWLAKNSPNDAIRNVLFGKQGEIVVNGVKYNNVMTPQNLSDAEIAAVLTYVYNKLNGINKTFKSEEVKAVRISK